MHSCTSSFIVIIMMMGATDYAKRGAAVVLPGCRVTVGENQAGQLGKCQGNRRVKSSCSIWEAVGHVVTLFSFFKILFDLDQVGPGV